MNNNGSYGILGNMGFANSMTQSNGLGSQPINDQSQVTAPERKGLTKAEMGSAVGGALSGLGSLINIFAQGDYQRQIGKQLSIANQQYDLQLSQITLNKDIADLGALKRANETYATQLAQAGASGMSPVSSAYGAALQNTVNNEAITEFSNTLTSTTQRLNTIFSKAAFAQQANQQIQASGNTVFSELLSGGGSIAAALALLL